jgi:hypothetical protein
VEKSYCEIVIDVVNEVDEENDEEEIDIMN